MGKGEKEHPILWAKVKGTLNSVGKGAPSVPVAHECGNAKNSHAVFSFEECMLDLYIEPGQVKLHV